MGEGAIHNRITPQGLLGQLEVIVPEGEAAVREGAWSQIPQSSSDSGYSWKGSEGASTEISGKGEWTGGQRGMVVSLHGRGDLIVICRKAFGMGRVRTIGRGRP